MSGQEKSQAKQEQKIAKEASKSKRGVKVKSIQCVPFGEEVRTGETVRESLKASIPFVRGKFRPDSLHIATLETEADSFQLVIPWSGKMALAHEFVAIEQGCLPESVGLKRSIAGSWGLGTWIDSTGQSDSDLPRAAENAGEKLCEGVEWNWEWGNYKSKLGWGLQMIPLGESVYLFMAKTASKGTFGWKAGLDWFVDRRQAFREFLDTVNIAGANETRFLFPTYSMLVLEAMGQVKLERASVADTIGADQDV